MSIRFHPACALLAAGFLAATSAHAQSQKPGLWEHTTVLKSASGEMAKAMDEMRKQLAAMPPAERKMMEQMMAQQGASMSADGHTTRMRYCLTPEEAAKADIPSHDDDCTHTITQRTANSMKVRFVCKDESKAEGEGSFTFNGNTFYSGDFKVRMLAEGKPASMDMTQSGRWVSSDCGNLRPKAPQRQR
ncbi:MAG TPA: DUF3617 domain-containing protein [Burkholderiaceae bacterium]|mgnify:CR=1 FL=1|nr:DUF3617 domain-containing protein [Burkholderiaceae bacterium]